MDTTDPQKIKRAYNAISNKSILSDIKKELTTEIATAKDNPLLYVAYMRRSLLHERMILNARNELEELNYYILSMEDDLLSKLYSPPEGSNVATFKKLNYKNAKKKIAAKVAKGEEFFANKQYSQAMVAFSAALILNPKHSRARIGRAFTCLELGQHNQILQDVAIIKESKNEADVVRATLILGYFHLKNDRCVEAVRCFDDIFPRLGLQERIDISVVCISLGYLDLAHSYCLAVLSAFPNEHKSLELLIDVAACSLSRKQWPLARKCYLKFIDTDHSFEFKALCNLGQIEACHGSYKRALMYFTKAKEHPDFAKQEYCFQKNSVLFGLLLCNMKLDNLEEVRINAHQLASLSSQWQVAISQFIIGRLSSKTKAGASMQINILGELPKELHPFIHIFFRSEEFSPILISLFANIKENQIKGLLVKNQLSLITADQLNTFHSYSKHYKLSALIALLCNPAGPLLLFLAPYIRDMISEEGLNTVVSCEDKPRSALSCLLRSSTGLNVLKKDPILCGKINPEGLDNEDFDTHPSPIFLLSQTLEGQKFLEKNDLLRSKISRTGLLVAITYAKKNNEKLALVWLTRELKRPQYQSLLLHHRLLFFKEISLLKANDQQVMVYSKPIKYLS